MVAFLPRFSLHYAIYRRYPLRPFKALKDASRIARA
jgi:hypothetical protein